MRTDEISWLSSHSFFISPRLTSSYLWRAIFEKKKKIFCSPPGGSAEMAGICRNQRGVCCICQKDAVHYSWQCDTWLTAYFHLLIFLGAAGTGQVPRAEAKVTGQRRRMHWASEADALKGANMCNKYWHNKVRASRMWVSFFHQLAHRVRIRIKQWHTLVSDGDSRPCGRPITRATWSNFLPWTERFSDCQWHVCVPFHRWSFHMIMLMMMMMIETRAKKMWPYMDH